MNPHSMRCIIVTSSPQDPRPCTICGEHFPPDTHKVYIAPVDDMSTGAPELLLHTVCAVRLLGWLQEAIADLPEAEAAQVGREAAY